MLPRHPIALREFNWLQEIWVFRRRYGACAGDFDVGLSDHARDLRCPGDDASLGTGGAIVDHPP